MQVDLLNSQRWNTRIELANAMFKYIEGFHNPRRRHNYLNCKNTNRVRATTPSTRCRLLTDKSVKPGQDQSGLQGQAPEVFGDHAVASAMIDRIVHHPEVLTLKGITYRLKDTMLTLPSE